MARRRHADARALLHALLDRHEANPAPAREQAELAAESFADAAARERFNALLGDAERHGAIRIRRGRGELRHLIAGAVLADPAALYRLLGRVPRTIEAGRTLAALREAAAGLPQPAGLADELAAFERAWLAGARHRGMAAADAAQAADYLAALAAVLARPPDDVRDLRTYSRQASGDSKRIERHRRAVVAAAADLGLVPADLPPEEAMATLGLEKFDHPVLMGGALSLGGTAFPAGSFLGVLPRDMPLVRVQAGAEALLTVENYASFNRHIEEAMGPREVVVYTGGWPSRAVVTVLRHLAPCVPRLLHWGDIDPHGAAIADYLWRTVDRRLRLHRMTPELAEAAGDTGRPVAFRPVAADSPARPLLDHLGRGGRTLEQEELDPAAVC